MSTVKKGLAIIILFFIVRSFVSCCDCSTDPEEGLRQYAVRDITLAALDHAGESYFISNDPIVKEAFGLAITFEFDQIAFCKPNQSMFTPAYACSCGTGNLYPVSDTIQSIQIVTVNELTPDYPAGSDVTELFKYHYDFEGGYFPIANYYAEPRKSTGLDEMLYVFLLTPPTAAGTYGFTVTIEMTNGRTLISNHEAELY